MMEAPHTGIGLNPGWRGNLKFDKQIETSSVTVGDVDDPGHPGPLLRDLHPVYDPVLSVDAPAAAAAAAAAVSPEAAPLLGGGAPEAAAPWVLQVAPAVKDARFPAKFYPFKN